MTEESVEADPGRDAERQRWPIGFMLLIGVTSLHLGWRLVQGIGALVGWMTG